MSRIEIIKPLHLSTTRDYAARRNDPGRAHNCTVAKQFGPDYWDGDRKYGYGGYRYDGRWRPVAEALAARYSIRPTDRVLDVGCGKGFLLYELMQVVPGVVIAGIDPSAHAIEHAHPEVRGALRLGTAQSGPWDTESYDVVISINALHNLDPIDVASAVRRINATANYKGRNYICVESWDTEQERLNLLDWQLTCECFMSADSWAAMLSRNSYRGDYELITFP